MLRREGEVLRFGTATGDSLWRTGNERPRKPERVKVGAYAPIVRGIQAGGAWNPLDLQGAPYPADRSRETTCLT